MPTEIEKLKEQIAELTEKNKSLEAELQAMKDYTIAYKAEMEEKLSEVSTKIAPEKVILSHEGKQYELIPRSLFIPEVGQINMKTIATEKEKVAIIVEKYSGLVKEIKSPSKK